jgi:hypothetical protein
MPKRICVKCGAVLCSYNTGDECFHHDRFRGDILGISFFPSLCSSSAGKHVAQTLRIEYGRPVH